MESNLFIELSAEQQEVVAGGASNISNTFLNQFKNFSSINLAFSSGTSSTKDGTTTGTSATYGKVNKSSSKNTGGGTSTFVPDFIFG